jgi:hypothetical protein
LTRAGVIGALALSALAACDATVSAERAYEQCSERARLAAQPRGSIGVGVGSEGPSAGASLTITSDFIAGRDPQLVYDNCFRQLTGAGPTRPLIL